jgi:SAM-dependent methyltransferase
VTSRTQRRAIFYQELEGRVPGIRFLDKSPGVRVFASVLARYLRRGARVLDVGCGVGIGTCHVAAATAADVSYVGLDPDPAACRAARAVLASLPPGQVRGVIVERTVQSYLATEALRADLIMWNCAFHECLNAADATTEASVVVGLSRLLEPTGVLLLGTPFIARGGTAEEAERIYVYAGHLAGRAGRDGPFPDPDRLVALFTAAGLVVVERHDTPMGPLTHYFGMPHARYALLVFRPGAASETGATC